MRLSRWLGLMIAAGIVVLAVRLFRIYQQMLVPDNNPRAFLARGRKPNTLVVCIGDSITHGVVSANYVELLQQRFAADGVEVVNAGINGNLAWNIVQRLDEIIACQPDIVTILIGTNDVNATYNQAWEDRYRRDQRIPQTPTLDWYCQNVEQIIDRLQTETKAQIALLELPILGEHLDSEINQRVKAYNAALKTIADQKGVVLLPLHQRLNALMPQTHTAPYYDGMLNLGYRAVLRHLFFGESWNSISADYGFTVLTDHIHLNDNAATVIAELIGSFVNSVQEQPT